MLPADAQLKVRISGRCTSTWDYLTHTAQAATYQTAAIKADNMSDLLENSGASDSAQSHGRELYSND